jgi:predicted transcriptional regulator
VSEGVDVMPKKVDLSTEAMVLTLYKMTNNISEIGRKVGLHRHTVRRILNNHGVLEDRTFKNLREEAKRLQRMKEKRKAYQKFRSQIELQKRELTGEEIEGTTPVSIHTFLEKSKEKAQARNVVINLLRELDRLAPRSFRNICRDERLSYDDVLEMMWGSGKMSKDTGRLLWRLSEYLDEFFVVGCRNVGTHKHDVPELVKEAEEEEYFYGKL